MHFKMCVYVFFFLGGRGAGLLGIRMYSYDVVTERRPLKRQFWNSILKVYYAKPEFSHCYVIIEVLEMFLAFRSVLLTAVRLLSSR